MNEPRQSDKPIVATKSLNNTGVKADAEEMEPRGLAKGNSAKQSVDRIQCRESMQRALERVRQAALREVKPLFSCKNT
jgi:hypothetical protein